MILTGIDITKLIDQAASLMKAGNHTDAESICHFILKHDPDNLEANFLIANSAYIRRNWSDAIKYYEKSVSIAPEIGILHANLASALLEAKQYKEAQLALDNSISIDGANPVNHFYQGLIFQQTDRIQDALLEYEKALLIDPIHIQSLLSLSALLIDIGSHQRAIDCCLCGLKHEPDNIGLTGNLAVAYGKEYRHDESLFYYNRLLEIIHPEDHTEIMGRIANILLAAWRVDESITQFEKAVSASTDPFQKRALASTRLFVLHYSPSWPAAAIATEHRAWGSTYFKKVESKQFSNNQDPERRLRIAYISPDLRIHAVIFFLQPVLAAHNHNQVEVYCYSDVLKPDEVTFQLRDKHNVIWRDIARKPDDDVQAMLADDQIDIAVELAGHTARNRLPLFSRRIAPVQVSWIGYPNTTGLSEMDYRITDPKADPPGLTEKFYTEELVRLPDSFLCYRPGGDFPAENPLPMLVNRFITFGSLSNFTKITTDMLNVWARILADVPDSKLVFRARGMTDERFRQDILPVFERYGVKAERIIILAHARSAVDNLKDYHRMDIALDTFPYHGTTTTCESLYMGVPVITLTGDSHLSRVGASLLESAGVAEFITETVDQYISTAVALASDLRKLLYLRKSLRSMVLASPLTDNVTFTHNMESAYRIMWKRWCAKQA